MHFNKFEKNKYSQFGEDGIIEEILNRLNLKQIDNFWCCEFGAWDGKYASNTFALVEKGWNAIYIEGNPVSFLDLKKNSQIFTKIIPIQAMISKNIDDKNSLDNILSNTKIPKDFEILSIDIDSYDLDVWENLQNYSPKIVIIEVDGTIPPGVVLRHSNKIVGNSFTATVNVGKKKGYTPICHTNNLFFIRNDLMNMINLDHKYIENPDLLFSDNNLTNGIFRPVDPFLWLTLITPKFLFSIMRIIKKILLKKN